MVQGPLEAAFVALVESRFVVRARMLSLPRHPESGRAAAKLHSHRSAFRPAAMPVHMNFTCVMYGPLWLRMVPH